MIAPWPGSRFGYPKIRPPGMKCRRFGGKGEEGMGALSKLSQWRTLAREAAERTAILAKFLCILHVTNTYICTPTLVRTQSPPPPSPSSFLFQFNTPSSCKLSLIPVLAGVRSEHAPDVQSDGWRAVGREPDGADGEGATGRRSSGSITWKP